MKVETKYKIGCLIGNTLYKLGFTYGATSDITDNLSLGYGKLDGYGFWQFPIDPCKTFTRYVISFFWQYQSIHKSLFVIAKEWYTPYDKSFDSKLNKWVPTIQYAEMICEFPKIKREK